MKIYKILLLVSILTFAFVAGASAQVLKYRTTSFSFNIKEDDKNWSNWQPFQPMNILITINTENDRITIYTAETGVYDIARNEGTMTDEDGDEFLTLFCVDEEGTQCYVQFVKLNSQNGQNQIYVKFSNLILLYNVYSLD